MRCCLALFAFLSLVACADDTPRGGTAVVRDSAGVRIVENAAPEWQSGEEWHLGSAPLVDIGGEATDPKYELFRVRDAWRLKDRRIVVANAGTAEVRVYGPTGEYLSSFGRRGGGPGEFESLYRLGLFRGDSLIVRDSRLERLSVFDTDGHLGRLVTLRSHEHVVRPVAVGVFEDASVLVRTGRVRDPSAPVPGAVRHDLILYRYSTGGTLTDSLGSFPGREMYYSDAGGGRIAFGRPLFGPTSYVAMGPDRIYVGVTDTYDIWVLTPNGRTLFLIRKRQEAVRATQDDIDFLLQRRLAEVDDPNLRRQLRDAFQDYPTRDQMPAFGWPSWGVLVPATPALQVDDGGNLWVVDHYRPAEERNSWTVFDPEGIWLGSVTLPGLFMPKHIGADFILGHWTDSLDVEHVQLYDLIKPEQ